ncbi:MAG TPA: Ig-like domain-containing protein [Gemmatimonadaceae bacterium]|nr:Ig-like domain-containing protein [Gemmatimonadaceae bacterium]
MRSSKLALVWRTVAAIAAVAGVACGGDNLEPSGGVVANVEVVPPTATVVLGTTVTLTASALDAAGKAISGRKVVWATADANFATVSATGVVTGRYVGSVPIAASIEGKSAIARVEVIPVPVVAVRVSPASRDLTVGETSQLTAEPLDARGAVLPGRSVAWSSSRPNVASVSASGAVTALSAGNAVVTATVDGKSGVAGISVSPAPVASVTVSPSSATLVVGQTLELEAQPRNASGQPLSGRAVAWSSNRPDVVVVSSAGTVAAVSAGTATITASSEGRTGSATIVVAAPTVNRVEVTPATAALDVGASFRLFATVYDSRGNVISGAQVAWASSDTRIATVDNTGRVLGVKKGSVIITATSADKAGTASVSVGGN